MSALNFEIRKLFFDSWKTELSNKSLEEYIAALKEELSNLQSYVTGGFFIYNLKESKCIFASSGVSNLTGQSLEEFVDTGFGKCFDHIHLKDLPLLIEFHQIAHEYVSHVPFKQKCTVEMSCIFRIVNSVTKNEQWCYSKTIPTIFDADGEVLISYEYVDPILYPYEEGFWWRVSFWGADGVEHFIESSSDKVESKPYNLLTKTEKVIGRYLLLSKTSKEIAEELSISKHTVDTHRKNIKKKLKTNSNNDFLNKLREINE